MISTDPNMPPSGSEPEKLESGMVREEPSPDQSTEALVKSWCSKVRKAKAHWDKDFKRMKRDMEFASGEQWPDKDSRNYVVNIVQRHIQQRVSSLYAKNPRAVVRRRQRMDFAKWDGSMKQLQILQEQVQLMQAGQAPPDPAVMEKILDIAQGSQNRIMLDKVAKTLEIIYAYIQDSQFPPYKILLKQLIRRTLICGFGWVKLGYQRLSGKRPEDIDKITGITEQLAKLERLLADHQDGEMAMEESEQAELTTLLKTLQETPDVIVHEGLTFDFPDTRSVIVDTCCKHLRTLTGARWAAEEYKLTKDDVKEIYKVDLSASGVTEYRSETSPDAPLSETTDAEGEFDKNKGLVCVWEVYDKTTGQVFTVCDGYCNYLRKPATPVIRLARFWPWFGLSFNELESDGECVSIYPISDVTLLRPQQMEYNRAREGLRRHRRFNSPRIITAKGMLDDEDIENLKGGDGMTPMVVQLNALTPDRKANDVLQPLGMPAIDPSLYDTEMIFQDVLRSVGTQEANLGGTAGGTATESSIAESSRMSSMASNVDDLDDMLTEIARASGELLLREMSPEKAKEIAGAGAVWPELSSQEIADELILEIEAGSSGRPNKAAEVANFEKLAPILMQTPGMSVEWFLKEAIKRLDDRMDPTDAIVADLPSIISMNAIKQQMMASGGKPAPAADPKAAAQGPASDPNAQGPAGANNAPMPPGIAGGTGGNEAALGGMIP